MDVRNNEDHDMEDAEDGPTNGMSVNGHLMPDDVEEPATSPNPFIDENAADEDEDEEDVQEDEDFLKSLKHQNKLPTGCCYDDRMKLHANPDFGPQPHHPEDPRRIEEIMKMFKKAGLVFRGTDTELARILRESPTKFMWRIPARNATQQEICSVHTFNHFNWVQSLSDRTTAQLRTLSHELDQGRSSLYVGALSYEAALLAAGGAIETCKNVMVGNVKNGIAIIRPPGHHAEYDQAMGFCLFNNVPIAAKICQLEYPETCRKVLILDWDVHHGNGTQNMFYQDPTVLYISLHVYQDGKFYPGKPDNSMMPDGGIDAVGGEAGRGKNVNIGWDDQGMGDGEYMAAFQKIVMPIAKEFNPDLVIVSAGFDAAEGDELGGCHVTPACYAHMTHMLMSLAGGKVAVCLEGGYNLKAISYSALAVARTLMGEPPPQMDISPPDKDAARVLAKVQSTHAQYWQCMRPGIIDMHETDAVYGMRLHDVLRTYQRHINEKKFSMIDLQVPRGREHHPNTYENQVLVSPGFQSRKTVLVIIHDPPELIAMPDLVENKVLPHNAFVIEGVSYYTEWAYKQGYGVMDVNIPHYVTKPEDMDPEIPIAPDKIMLAQMKELLHSIWDNYLQFSEDQTLFVMGAGNAYLGVKLLLVDRKSKEHIAGVINFVTGDLRAVKSAEDEDLSAWYKANSLVYVSKKHGCWSDEEYLKKVKKQRYGHVICSSEDGINQMMRVHADEVQNWIAGKVSADAGETADVVEVEGTCWL